MNKCNSNLRNDNWKVKKLLFADRSQKAPPFGRGFSIGMALLEVGFVTE
jgi:hypothetical protein